MGGREIKRWGICSESLHVSATLSEQGGATQLKWLEWLAFYEHLFLFQANRKQVGCIFKFHPQNNSKRWIMVFSFLF